MQVSDGRGAFCLLIGNGDAGARGAAASLAVRYSRHRQSGRVEVLFRRRGDEERLEARAATDEDLERWRL